jgi:hypothetical protein
MAGLRCCISLGARSGPHTPARCGWRHPPWGPPCARGPWHCAPLGAVTSTLVPVVMRPSSAEVTSPRHSSRPWRIRRNSSVPAPTTEPTVALRAEMTPLSGASNWVCFRRSSWASSCALADSTRALRSARRQVLADLLGAQGAAVLHHAGALGVGGGLGGVGLASLRPAARPGPHRPAHSRRQRWPAPGRA